MRNVVNKAKLQYNTCMKVAGCGQVDYGISDDFESEGNAGLVNFQLNRQGSRCLSEICVNRPFRDLRQPTRNITYFASVKRKMRSLQHTPWN